MFLPFLPSSPSCPLLLPWSGAYTPNLTIDAFMVQAGDEGMRRAEGGNPIQVVCFVEGRVLVSSGGRRGLQSEQIGMQR